MNREDRDSKIMAELLRRHPYGTNPTVDTIYNEYLAGIGPSLEDRRLQARQLLNSLKPSHINDEERLKYRAL